MSGIVEGPPDSMVGSVVEVAKKYFKTTDEGSEIVKVNVYEV